VVSWRGSRRTFAHDRAKRDAMKQALRTTLGELIAWTEPRGGFFLWAELPETSTRCAPATSSE
jgi:DNA-binding transcriptional MocR family regulator